MTKEFDPRKSYLAVKANEKMIACKTPFTKSPSLATLTRSQGIASRVARMAIRPEGCGQPVGLAEPRRRKDKPKCTRCLAGAIQ